MNVLILTPDAVGSTLLQRLITIYMQFYDFDRPVINLHELTNGIAKYFSPEFNQEILSKRPVSTWGYHQSLEEIIGLLSSVDHYKTSRLAHYHIRNRGDTIEQQVPFYRYLDENFFVIACRRRNVFEHALSMSINNITKKLNVYSHDEKINSLLDLYLDPVLIDQKVLLLRLDAYKKYLAWSENHFNIGSFFHYDTHLHDLENYILSLPMFCASGKTHTWQTKFGISLDDWNRYHHIHSDLDRLDHAGIRKIKMLDTQSEPSSQDLLSFYQQNAPAEWPAVHKLDDLDSLPRDYRRELANMVRRSNRLPVILDSCNSHLQNFALKNRSAYERAHKSMLRMQELDIMISAPPIKKQTLSEKIRTVKNFDQCVDTYNQWLQSNSEVGAEPVTQSSIDQQIRVEESFWRDLSDRSVLKHVESTIDQSEYQNDDSHEPNPI